VAAGLPLAVVLALAGAFTALSTGHKPAQAGMLIALAETPSQLAAANACGAAWTTPASSPAHRAQLSGSRIAHELLLGTRSVTRDAGLRTVVGVSAATTAVHGAVDVLIVVLAIDVLPLGDAGVGWLSAVWARAACSAASPRWRC
jgi:hypothetical protein